MSDIRSDTKKKLPDLPKFCLVCLAGPAVNDNTVSLHKIYMWFLFPYLIFFHPTLNCSLPMEMIIRSKDAFFQVL